MKHAMWIPYPILKLYIVPNVEQKHKEEETHNVTHVGNDGSSKINTTSKQGGAILIIQTTPKHTPPKNLSGHKQIQAKQFNMPTPYLNEII